MNALVRVTRASSEQDVQFRYVVFHVIVGLRKLFVHAVYGELRSQTQYAGLQGRLLWNDIPAVGIPS